MPMPIKTKGTPKSGKSLKGPGVEFRHAPQPAAATQKTEKAVQKMPKMTSGQLARPTRAAMGWAVQRMRSPERSSISALLRRAAGMCVKSA